MAGIKRKLCFLLFFATAGCFLLFAEQNEKILEGEMFPIPESTHNGSGYTAIACGNDGNIYVGTAFYGSSAHLVCFNPKRKTWTDLIDAHKVTRENGAGLDSQSKFHAKILVDADGVIWAATKQGNEDFENRPEFGESATGYPGGHLFSYNPRTREVRDHGILRKQEGIMGGSIDRVRKRLYYWSDPKQHFLAYDITTGTLKDYGEIGGSPRYTAIDRKGRVFGTGRQGIIWMYDPSDDRLYDLQVTLEGPGKYADPYAIALSDDGNKIFGCAINGEYVMEFDLSTIAIRTDIPGADGTIVCRNRARSIPEPLQPGDQHSGVLGTDGCFYFPNTIGDKCYMIRYDPRRPEKVENLGVIKVKGHPELKPLYVQGMCTLPDGTIYMKFISYGKLMPYSIMKFARLSRTR